MDIRTFLSCNSVFFLLHVGSYVCYGDERRVLTAKIGNNTQFVGVASKTEFDNQTYVTAKFLGIRYATPPTGENRFEVAGPVYPNGTFVEATYYKAICHQPVDQTDKCQQNRKMDEDCLYLNIFVPTSFKSDDLTTATSQPTPSTSNVTLPSNISTGETYEDALKLKPDEKFAVFIYIHGGGFYQGSGNCYDGSLLVSLGRILVVTINYRLSALGFLYANDDAISGNLGLFDQSMAIYWVNKNIHLFGGDPDRITVGGQSAGSYSAIYQALQDNYKLFHRVIAQSGTPAAPKSVSTVGHATALAVAKSFNCTIKHENRGHEILDCMMKQSAQALAEALPPILIPFTLAIEPTLDGFIRQDPYKVFSRVKIYDNSSKPAAPSSFVNKSLLIGFNAYDGEVAYRLRELQVSPNNIFQNLRTPIDRAKFKLLITEFFQESYSDVIDDIILEAVLDRYIDWEQYNDANRTSNTAIEWLTDAVFAIPSLDTASTHFLSRPQENSSTGISPTTFVYKFTLPKTDPATYQVFMPWFEGTTHSAELKYIFSKVNGTDEIRISKYMITYWSNFVKTGNPNQDEIAQTPQNLPVWEEYTESDQSYLDIVFNPGPQSKKRLLADKRHFWTDFIPMLKNHLKEVYKTGQVCSHPNSGTPLHTSVTRLIFVVLSAYILAFQMFI